MAAISPPQPPSQARGGFASRFCFAALLLALGPGCGDDTSDGGGGSGADGGGGGSGAAGGEGGTGGETIPKRRVGSPCAIDEECEGGLCLTEEAFGWANGYCSALCEEELQPCEVGQCLPAGESASVCLRECSDTTGCEEAQNCRDQGAFEPLLVCVGGCETDSECTVACDADRGICSDAENCDNRADDDDDGLYDCFELDCASETICTEAIADACEGAIELQDGDSEEGTTEGGSAVFVGDCVGPTGAYLTGFGSESIYTFTAPADGSLTVTATPEAGSDISIHARSTCSDASTQVACENELFDSEATERLEIDMVSGQVVFLYADASSAATEGSFTIAASFQPIVCGDGIMSGVEECDDGGVLANDGCSPTCEVEPTPFCASAAVRNILVGGELSGDTSSGTDGFSGTCAGDGPELVYRYTPLETGTVTIIVDADPDFDPVLYVRTACDNDTAAAELDCHDTNLEGGNESLTVPVTIGVPVFIFVDTFTDNTTGDFLLSIQ